MISRNTSINAFIKLGEFIINPESTDTINEWILSANGRNNWFTPENVARSLNAISTEFLTEENLAAWTSKYPVTAKEMKVGVVMAGNIPAVGFHDALCVLISGHTLLAKFSSDDSILMRLLLEKLIEIEPEFSENVHFVERLNDSDAYIATGSNNTARYFEYYFSKKPHIIRKNRSSIAVLSGQETTEQLFELGRDVFQYFGLGCRNVSKFFVPAGYDFTKFYEAIESFAPTLLNHHKYFNNYEYNKSIMLVNRVLHYDNGFLLLTESEALVSPISVIHFEYYKNLEDVRDIIDKHEEKIQCVVAGEQIDFPESVPFGKSQQPELFEYADSVDTMQFLTSF